MDILKTAIDWTKAEMLSSSVFILFGLAFAAASFGFWQLGKTELARAYVVPMLVAGGLLLVIGLGIFLQSQSRVTSFAVAHQADPDAFIAAETKRAERVLNDYRIAVFRVIPLIVAACAVGVMFFDAPIFRASLTTTIAMMSVILLVDTNASTRLQDYRHELSAAGGHSE